LCRRLRCVPAVALSAHPAVCRVPCRLRDATAFVSRSSVECLCSTGAARPLGKCASIGARVSCRTWRRVTRLPQQPTGAILGLAVECPGHAAGSALRGRGGQALPPLPCPALCPTACLPRQSKVWPAG